MRKNTSFILGFGDFFALGVALALMFFAACGDGRDHFGVELPGGSDVDGGVVVSDLDAATTPSDADATPEGCVDKTDCPEEGQVCEDGECVTSVDCVVDMDCVTARPCVVGVCDDGHCRNVSSDDDICNPDAGVPGTPDAGSSGTPDASTPDCPDASPPCLPPAEGCDDDDVCNGVFVWNPSACSCDETSPPIVCDDSNDCTTESCQPSTGVCQYEDVVCDDSNACTTDTCDPSGGCNYEPVTCGDGEVCDAGDCVCDGDADDADDGVCGAGKVLLCHYPPGGPDPHEVCVASEAVSAHEAHGDTVGECPCIPD